MTAVDNKLKQVFENETLIKLVLDIVFIFLGYMALPWTVMAKYSRHEEIKLLYIFSILFIVTIFHLLDNVKHIAQEYPKISISSIILLAILLAIFLVILWLAYISYILLTEIGDDPIRFFKYYILYDIMFSGVLAGFRILLYLVRHYLPSK